MVKSVLRRCCVLLLLLLLLPYSAAAAAETGTAVKSDEEANTASVWEPGDTSYKDTLSGIEITVYEKLETAFAADAVEIKNGYWWLDGAYTESFAFSGNGNTALKTWLNSVYSSVNNACVAFLYDHPEYFWIRMDCRYSTRASVYQNTMTASVSVGFRVQPSCGTKAVRDSLKTQVDAVVETLMTATENMGVVEKLAYWDNWLAANNAYNTEAARNLNSIKVDDTPWNVSGALLSGKSPVCEGYAKAFQLLCHKAGIPCLQMSGTSKGQGHMWTAVQVDGAWYLCDPAWNDPLYRNAQTGRTTQKDFSVRTYFLTAQSAEYVRDSVLAYPTMAEKDYFTDWDLTTDALLGSEVGNNRMMIVLYDANGNMIARENCPRFYWTGEGGNATYRCIAPSFSAEALGRTVRAARVYVNDAYATWGSRPIS